MRSPAGASAAILRSIRRGEASLQLSVPLAIEYEAVCQQGEHRLAAGLSQAQVDIFVTAVMVLEAAVNGRADALVTFNMRDYGEAPSHFGVELLLPRIAIGRITR
jgi:hypothetical protein